jgi:hypothetical protein
VRRLDLEHRFPRREARFEQRLTLDGGSAITTVTDICPRGTTKAPGDDEAICVR